MGCLQGRIQELARGGAQTGQVVSGWGEPDSLVQCYIFEAANDHLPLLYLPLLVFSDGCEVLKTV